MAKAGDKKETETVRRPKQSPSNAWAKKTSNPVPGAGNKAALSAKKSTAAPSNTESAESAQSELRGDQAAPPQAQDNQPAPPHPAPAVQETAQEEVSELEGVRLPAARGRTGIFGGPKDRSAKPEDKLALPTGLHFQYERYRTLNPNHFYCAMRWDYRQNHMSAEEGKRWFANKKIRVINPRNGVAVILRAVDYGPHESTGLIMSISPAAAEALGLADDDEIKCEFADQKSRFGIEQ